MGTVTESIDDAVARTIDESALAGERIVAIARLVFVGLLFVRSIYALWAFWDVADHVLERAIISYPPQLIAIGFSIAILCGVGRRRPKRVLHISVALDIAVGFLVLLPNALWPGPAYRGTPYMIDTSALLMLVVAAGLRQSATAVALGSGFALLALGGLAIADYTYANVDATSMGFGYTIYGLLLCTVAGLSLIIAIRTRTLVERAARVAVVASRAEHGLRTVLHEHHDLRSVIASAQINADLLARASSASGKTLDHLREDLGELRSQLDQVKARALEELSALEDVVPVAVEDAIGDVTTTLGPRFPAVSIRMRPGRSREVMVAGGPTTLRRILANLVVNACEGDGARGARTVDIGVHEAGSGRVTVEIADDGPGPPARLLEQRTDVVSTKPEGTGVGIRLVEGLVRASGGTVSWSARDGGGTRVCIELPTAGPTT